MFSQFITAAKGLLLPGQDSIKTPTNRRNRTTTSASPELISAKKPKMVTATRRRTFGGDESENVLANGISEVNGKRKSESTNSTGTETQRNKRRKKSSLGVEQETKQDIVEEEAEPTTGGTHMRFDSEEPDSPALPAPEEVADTRDENQDEAENSSDDDEAPEVVDNSAQLSKIKLEAKKQEKAKQLEEQLKKEKRRQLDEKRKLQAKSSSKKKPAAATDDIMSESSETLQGSFTLDAGRPALPALLPDDILNAVPAARPPTPPAEIMDFSQKKPTKLKFLDKKEKAPKDVRMDDVTIRVLGDTLRKQSGAALPPKASKSGRSSKENWLKQTRSTGYINGLRRTGSSKGFVRK